MAHVAIMKVEPSGRAGKYAAFDTEKEAQDHVAAFAERFPDAFTVEADPDQWASWYFDENRNLSIVPPEPVPQTEERNIAADLDALAAAIVKKGVVTEQEIEAEKPPKVDDSKEGQIKP